MGSGDGGSMGKSVLTSKTTATGGGGLGGGGDHTKSRLLLKNFKPSEVSQLVC